VEAECGDHADVRAASLCQAGLCYWVGSATAAYRVLRADSSHGTGRAKSVGQNWPITVSRFSLFLKTFIRLNILEIPLNFQNS
jgi:hypothetical protein